MPTVQLNLVLGDRLTGLMADAIVVYRDPIELVLADDLGQGWNDSNVASNFNPVRIVSDNLNSWADALTTSITNGIGIIDDMGQNWKDDVWSNFYPAYQFKDQLVLSDAFAFSLKNGVGCADSLNNWQDFVQIRLGMQISEAMAQADSLSFALGSSNVAVADALAFSDALAATLTGIYSLPFAESLSMTDSVALGFIAPLALSFSDTLNLKDAVATVTLQGAALQIRVNDTLALSDGLSLGFAGQGINPPNTSTGTKGNVSVIANGSVLGTLLIGDQIKYLYETLYRYANLDLPFSPNDPGLAYTYQNTDKAASVPLAARFFNLLDEVSDPLFFDVGFSSASGLIIDCIDVRTTGAKGDGITNDTAAIMTALDEAHENYLNALAGLVTGPTRVCIPSGLVCMVGGGFWASAVGLAWPNNPGKWGLHGAFPPAGTGIANSNTADSGSAIDSALFVRSGVTVQLDGRVKIITDPTQFIGTGPETTVWCYYDNDFATGRTFPNPTYVPPAKGVSMNASLTGVGVTDASMDGWISLGSVIFGSGNPASNGYGIGVYALVGNNCQFTCEGITITQAFGMGVYVEGNINDTNSFASAHVRDCVVDTFGNQGINGFFIDATYPVMTGIAVWANGVEVARKRVINGLDTGIIQQFDKAFHLVGKNISLTSNSAKSVFCGLWLGSYQRLGNRNVVNGGLENVKVTQNTFVGPIFDGYDPANVTVPGIIFASIIGDPFGGPLHTDGVLDYVSGVDIGDNIVSGFYDGIQNNRNNFFLTSFQYQGGMYHVNIHDNSFTDNVAYGIELFTPPGGGFHDVNLWGNMEENNGLGSVSINGNVDGAAGQNPVPGLGIGSVGPITPGGPPVISTPGGNLSGDPGIYEIVAYSPGSLISGQVFLEVELARLVNFPVNFAGSRGKVTSAPNSTVTLSVQKNGVEVGTISVDTGGNFTFATTAGLVVSFLDTNVLTVIGPAPAVPSLIGLSITLVGSRI